MLLAFYSSNDLSAFLSQSTLRLISYLSWPVFADRASAFAATFTCFMQESTIIFLFFNEALRSVYIVINKVITAAMAFRLSYLENWMQNLFNSSVRVSWSVTDFYNDSCNTSAIIYWEAWTLWPFPWVLVHLQLSWGNITADACVLAPVMGVCQGSPPPAEGGWPTTILWCLGCG